MHIACSAREGKADLCGFQRLVSLTIPADAPLGGCASAEQCNVIITFYHYLQGSPSVGCCLINCFELIYERRLHSFDPCMIHVMFKGSNGTTKHGALCSKIFSAATTHVCGCVCTSARFWVRVLGSAFHSPCKQARSCKLFQSNRHHCHHSL